MWTGSEPCWPRTRPSRPRATPTGARTLRRGRARRVETLQTRLATLSPTELATLGEGVEVLERILRDR